MPFESRTGKAAVSRSIDYLCRRDPRICQRIDRGEETFADVLKIRRTAYGCLKRDTGLPVERAYAEVDREIRRRNLGSGIMGPWR